MKQIIPLKSGHQLTFNIAPLETSQNLLHVLAAEMRTVNVYLTPVFIDLLVGTKGEPNEARAGKLLGGLLAQDSNMVWQAILALLASRPIKQAVYDCAMSCMLNARGQHEQIVPSSFEPENARQDWIPVAREVIKGNLLPFAASLLSPSSIPGGQSGESPR